MTSPSKRPADEAWKEVVSPSNPNNSYYMQRLRDAVEASAREIAREEIRRLQQQVDRIGHRLDYLYRVVLPPGDQEEEESDRDRKDALLYDEYHKRMGLVKEEPEPEGMTLRDWFAGQALAGLVQLDPRDAAHMSDPKGRKYGEWVTSDAYAIADAMLAAREEISDGD